MDKLSRLGWRVIEKEAFVSPYLLRPVRSVEEVLAVRRARTERERPDRASGVEPRQSAKAAAGR